MFRRQLVVGHGALVLVTMVTGVAAVIALQITHARLEGIATDLEQDVLNAQHLEFLAERMVATSRGYLLTGERASFDRFEQAAALVEQNLASFAVTDDERELAAATRDYVSAARRAAAKREDTTDPREILPFFERTLQPARGRFEAAVSDFVARQASEFDDNTERARDRSDQMRAVVIATTTLAIGIAALLAWASVRKLQLSYKREHDAADLARHAVEARDEQLAIVSHDLRSPLTSVMLGAAVLDESVTDPKIRKRLGAIQRGCAHMQRLIDELVDLARLDSGTFAIQNERIPLATMFDELYELFAERANRAEIQLVLEPGDRIMIRGDHERLVRVLTNLVGNALRFTPAGGRITVTATRENDRVRIAVGDTGSGVPEADIAHLFDRYWQGRRRGSLGLGLYICKQIVEAHGGTITVESDPGRGATFSFTLREEVLRSHDGAVAATEPARRLELGDS